MKKRAIPAWLQRSIERSEKARKAHIIARPMRALFAQLKRGEVDVIDDQPVIWMDAIGELPAQWAAAVPAIIGWIECWERIDASIDHYHLKVLVARLSEGKEITPRLAERAEAEYEAAISRVIELPDGRIDSAIRTTQIAWELERVAEVES